MWRPTFFVNKNIVQSIKLTSLTSIKRFKSSSRTTSSLRWRPKYSSRSLTRAKPVFGRVLLNGRFFCEVNIQMLRLIHGQIVPCFYEWKPMCSSVGEILLQVLCACIHVYKNLHTRLGKPRAAFVSSAVTFLIFEKLILNVNDI